MGGTGPTRKPHHHKPPTKGSRVTCATHHSIKTRTHHIIYKLGRFNPHAVLADPGFGPPQRGPEPGRFNTHTVLPSRTRPSVHFKWTKDEEVHPCPPRTRHSVHPKWTGRRAVFGQCLGAGSSAGRDAKELVGCCTGSIESFQWGMRAVTDSQTMQLGRGARIAGTE